MPTLIAIGYPDETTASAAADEASNMARDRGTEPEAIAVVSRDRHGAYQVDTHHSAVSGGDTWGAYWGVLFGVLLFAPAPGAPLGPRLRALLGKVARSGIDPEVQARVRDLPQPGTSALFLVVDPSTSDTAVERLRRFGGTVLTAPLGAGPG